MSATTNTLTLDFVEEASGVMHKAAKLAQEKLDSEKAARPLVDEIVDTAIKQGKIAESEREELAKLASTHEGALKLSRNLLRLPPEKTAQVQTQPPSQGQPAGQTKSASVASTESPFVGRRAGLSEKRASDEALFAGLGMDVNNPAGSRG